MGADRDGIGGLELDDAREGRWVDSVPVVAGKKVC
jgi:hypothetical protein